MKEVHQKHICNDNDEQKSLKKGADSIKMKIMKRINLLLLLLLTFTMLALASCTKEDNIPSVNTTFTVSKTELQFAKSGGEAVLYVRGAEKPVLSSSETWLKITPLASTSKTVYKFQVAIEPNTAFNDRKAAISVSVGGESKHVDVTQMSTEGLVIKSAKTLDVGANGGEIEVALQANYTYTVAIAAEWISAIEGTRANMKDYKHRFLVGKNFGTARTTTISFTLSKGDVSLTEAVTVKQSAGTQLGDMSKSATELAALMYPGWNLGNTLEAGDAANNFTNKGGLASEMAWQSTKTSQKVIDEVKKQGFKSVRLPIAWVMGHLTDQVKMTIDEAWMARVKEVVNYCIADGLYVIINDHWDGGWLEVDGFSSSRDHFQVVDEATVTAKMKQLKALWTNISLAFKDYDEHVLFAGLNEPFQNYKLFNGHHQELTPILQRYNQAFVDAVRATGGNNASRVLVVQGPATNINSTCSYLHMPNDTKSDRLMVEVHYYDPWDFTSGSVENWTDTNSVKVEFDKLKTTFVDRNIPVIIGECGANWQKNEMVFNATLKLWYKTVFQYAGQRGIVAFAWDINVCSHPNMSIIDRARQAVWNKPAMEGIAEGVAAAR